MLIIMDRVILYLFGNKISKSSATFLYCTNLCKMEFPFFSINRFSIKTEQSSYWFWHSTAGLQVLVKGWTPLGCFEQDTWRPRPFVRDHMEPALHGCWWILLRKNTRNKIEGRRSQALENKWNYRKMKLVSEGRKR